MSVEDYVRLLRRESTRSYCSLDPKDCEELACLLEELDRPRGLTKNELVLVLSIAAVVGGVVATCWLWAYLPPQGLRIARGIYFFGSLAAVFMGAVLTFGRMTNGPGRHGNRDDGEHRNAADRLRGAAADRGHPQLHRAAKGRR